MSPLDKALKRVREETGTVPETMAGAAEWLPPPDAREGEGFDGLLDRFSAEAAPGGTRHDHPGQDLAAGDGAFPAEAPVPEPEAFPLEVEPRDHREPRPAAPAAAPWAFPTEDPVGSQAAPPSARREPPGLFNGFNPHELHKLVTGPQMDHATVEQYGRLAAVLHHAQTERGIKSVMVTSALAGEGKTLTALNLALTLAESYGRRVAFIDADLRCSRVHELLNVVRVTGLGEALQDDEQTQARLLAISPRLSVLLAGCANLDPKEALTSRRMAEILAEAAASFEWVIVDTPPVNLLPDTNLLARMIDVAVVVVRAGETAYDVVEQAVQAIDRKRVIGVVLNDVSDAEALQYYYARSGKQRA